MDLSPELACALAACQAIKTDTEEFCYSWIAETYKQRGVAPWHLKQLAQRGYLKRVDGSRGGHRAYYRFGEMVPVHITVRDN